MPYGTRAPKELATPSADPGTAPAFCFRRPGRDAAGGAGIADLRPRQEVLDLIHDARDAGIHVGILSNSWGTGTYDPYDGYGLDRLVDAVVISDQVGSGSSDVTLPG